MSARAQVISRSRQAHSSAARRRAAPVICLAACLLSRANAAAAFSSNRFTATKRRTRRSTTIHHSAPEQSPLGDEPWKEDDSYWDMLQAASKDPETFEKFIEESMARKQLGKGGTTPKAKRTPIAKCKLTGVGGGGTAPKKKGKYVPIEEWDARRENGEGASREERLQWEARRDGDGYRQNEILRHNLKSF